MLLPDSDTPKELSIAESLIPWRNDDNRARYLGYLACGFSVEEALYMIGMKMVWLEEQRLDETFNTFELKIPEIRKELSKEYIELDFFRNFRMVLEKDYRVLKHSLELQEDESMIPQEHQYLLKMRSAYTPQQLQIIEQIMKGTGGGDFNFARMVAENQGKILELSRTEKITVRDKTNGEKDYIEQG